MKKLFCLFALSVIHMNLNAQTTITPEVVLIKADLNPTGQAAYIGEYKAHNGKLYFNSVVGFDGGSICATDGTTAGTGVLKTFPTQPYVHSFSPAGSKLVFLVNTGTGSSETSKLYSTDGTVAGTQMIASGLLVLNDLSGADAVVSYNGKAYFAGNDGVHGTELWVTDGTDAGTVMVKDIAPGADSSRPVAFAAFKNKLYFVTTNNVDRYYLYLTDGTANGTSMVKEMVMTNPVFEYVTGMAEYNNKLYFTLYDGSAGSYLYATDGTTAGTTYVQDLYYMSSINRHFTFNNKLYFVARGGMGYDYLWQSDGTTSGTSSILTAHLMDAIAFNNHLLIGKVDYNGEGELISNTNGGATGTTLMTISSGSLFLYPHDFVISNGALYFLAPTDHSNQNIYSTDGTVAGTVIVGPHNPTFLTGCSSLKKDAVLNDSLYFEGNYITNNGSTDLYKLRLNVQTNGIREIDNGLAEATLYPNPAHATTMVSYKLNQPDVLTITVSDMTGRTLQTIVKKQEAGIYMQALDVAYSAGIYMVHIKGTHADAALKLMVK